MADDGAKSVEEPSDLPKDVLAPAEGPRENLVVTAVKFLQNPKVRHSPLSKRKAFLESKGLTSEEIQLAVQRAGVTDDTSSQLAAPISPYQHQHPAVYANTALVPQQQSLPPPIPVSPWTKAREMAVTAAIIAAFSYAAYNLYKTYIKPWLLGKSQSEARLERLEAGLTQLHTSIAESNALMLETLQGIQVSITQQQDKNIQNSEVSFRQETNSLNDIKSEVASLKGLLLSRRQFPPPPSLTPIIPAWQKMAPQEGQTKESESQVVTELGNEASHVSDQEMVPSTHQDLETATGPILLGQSTSLSSQTSEESFQMSQVGAESSDISLGQTLQANNGFEMVKPNSDSDTAAELD